MSWYKCFLHTRFCLTIVPLQKNVFLCGTWGYQSATGVFVLPLLFHRRDKNDGLPSVWQFFMQSGSNEIEISSLTFVFSWVEEAVE